jgi:hypothetical protein
MPNLAPEPSADFADSSATRATPRVGGGSLHGRAAASATSAHADESSAGRIGWFTTDSPTPVPPRGWEGLAVGELNRQAVTKVNHIE